MNGLYYGNFIIQPSNHLFISNSIIPFYNDLLQQIEHVSYLDVETECIII